jgi:hypothetical protein
VGAMFGVVYTKNSCTSVGNSGISGSGSGSGSGGSSGSGSGSGLYGKAVCAVNGTVNRPIQPLNVTTVPGGLLYLQFYANARCEGE